ncbi:hypothetical protein TcWFU_000465 [Taenia crassiceps]|uniref:Uncharacterized protein n=1 Tax=Taenia crassiceps TaxID=6207 RepID=A0ABR4QP57_9CEST
MGKWPVGHFLDICSKDWWILSEEMLGQKFNTSKRLLSVTFLMLVLPIFSYFFSRRIFKGKIGRIWLFLEYFDFSDGSVYIASAAVSVIMIHGVLVGVIILAFKEDQLQTLEEKED